jgi:hypothetical protein
MTLEATPEGRQRIVQANLKHGYYAKAARQATTPQAATGQKAGRAAAAPLSDESFEKE